MIFLNLFTCKGTYRIDWVGRTCMRLFYFVSLFLFLFLCLSLCLSLSLSLFFSALNLSLPVFPFLSIYFPLSLSLSGSLPLFDLLFKQSSERLQCLDVGLA